MSPIRDSPFAIRHSPFAIDGELSAAYSIDVALHAFAVRDRNQLRSADTPARWGGEEVLPLRRVDEALYSAKRKGRNRVVRG